MPSDILASGFIPCRGIVSALKILRYWGSYLSLDAPHADSLESGGGTTPTNSESDFK